MKDNYIFLKNDSIDQEKWNTLLKKSKYANPFQSAEFYDFCNNTENHKGFAGVVIGDKNEFNALCVADIIEEKGIKSYFTRRAIIFGGPLLSDEQQERALSVLLENLHKELKNEVIYIETRNFKDYSGYTNLFRQKDWKYVPYLNVRKIFSEKNLEDLKTSFKYNRRREIILTLKSGITYGEINNEDDIKEVHKILQDIYHKRIGLPLPSPQYFIDFFRTGLLKIFKVEDQGVIVGGSFCVVMKDEGIFTFYYCGKRDYKPNVFPTHLAVFAAMEYGIKNGLKYIDFMGAGKPDTEYGVRSYKLEFGGELVEEGRFLKVEKRLLYNLGTKVINFKKRQKMKSIEK